jgi:endonuclease/exonuclease/phosphatase family metal-dependent hydrolase
MTANLYNGRARPEALREVIQAFDPDVLAVQEISPNAAGVIADAFPFRQLEPRDDTLGLGLALRRPGVVDRVPLGDRTMQRVVLDPAYWLGLGSQVEVLNVHLHNPLDGVMRAARAVRRRQLAALHEALAPPSPPRVLVGDLNATPLWPLYRRLREVATDAACAVDSTRATWAPWPWLPRLLRIDHVFVQGLVPTAAETIHIRGSDHSALVVDLDVPTVDAPVTHA